MAERRRVVGGIIELFLRDVIEAAHCLARAEDLAEPTPQHQRLALRFTMSRPAGRTFLKVVDAIETRRGLDTIEFDAGEVAAALGATDAGYADAVVQGDVDGGSPEVFVRALENVAGADLAARAADIRAQAAAWYGDVPPVVLAMLEASMLETSTST